MEEMSKARRMTYHAVSIALLLGTLAFAIFRFQGVFLRVIQTAIDLVLSVLFYFSYMFDGPTVPVTVTVIPSGMTGVMPMTPDEFIARMSALWELLISGDNVSAYFAIVGDVLYNIVMILGRLALPIVFLVWIIGRVYDRVEELDERGEVKKEATLPVRICWWIEKRIYYPVKREIKAYLAWLSDSRYLTALKWGWAYNLNVLTVVGELFAFVFYFAMAWDWQSLFTATAKLIMDASVPLGFLPWWLTAIIAWKVFDRWRRKIGYQVLEYNEAQNQAFLEENPENFIATGRPRVGKTQTITDMAQSQQVIFRKKAYEKMFDRRMEFPSFPWEKLNQTLIRMSERVPTFNLTFIHTFLSDLQRYWTARNVMIPLRAFACLSYYKKCGYVGKDFLFGYDYKTYGMIYHNGAQVVELFDCVERYAQDFYVYSAPTPLIVSNYPINTSLEWIDYGHFPLMNENFFRSDPALNGWSQYSHLAILDAFRLGKKKDPNNPWKDSFEGGVLTLTELGKELGNQNTNQGKKADSDECNVRNDLFVVNVKMQGQGSTIDYQTVFRILADEQRAASIMADFKELGSELMITERTDPKIVLPFYLIEETLYMLSTGIMKRVHEFFSVRRTSRNFIHYLCGKLYAPIYNHHKRIENVYQTHDVIFKIVDHSAGERLTDSRKFRYHISTKKNAGAYNTAFFGSVYRVKRSHSKAGGINQMPQFGSLDPTPQEMSLMGSHFFDSLDVMFEQGEPKKPEKGGNKSA